MKMLAEEFIDSNKITSIAIPVTMLRYLPVIESSGSTHTAMKNAVNGTKQAMKSVEIMTIILETFWFLPETLSACPEDVNLFLHFVVLCSFTTNIDVQTMMVRNAVKGIIMLLMAKETFSTFVRPSL